MNIENKRQLAIILFAVGLGLGASIIMSKVVNDKIAEQTKVIANEYQDRNKALVQEIDTTKKMLNQLAKEHAALVKRVSEQPPVRQIVQPAPKPQVQQMAFSLRTPPGKRAITMAIDSLSAVGGLINPGDFVDILATLDVPESVDENNKKRKEIKKITTVLFQNVQVLAVGTNYDPTGVAPAYEMQKNLKKLNVTFAVDPEEVGLLDFAQANGSLRLSLRSAKETQDRVLQQVASWNALSDFVLQRQGTELGLPKKAPVDKSGKEVVETKPFVQIFRGGKEL